MKYALEWGNGRTVVAERPSLLSRFRRLEAHGGSGATVGGDHPMDRYCLKIVSLREKDGHLNDQFWDEARSVSLYTSVARNIPGCAACPLPACYWIHEKDPLYGKYLRARMSGERPRTLIDHLSLFNVAPEQLESPGIDDPEAFWFVPPPLLKQIYDAREHDRPARLLLTYPVLRGEVCLRDDPLNNPLEIRRMIYHVLSAILTLYRNGLAHGDVKPANIMRLRPFGLEFGRDFSYFLTDIGSVHSGNQPSDTYTEVFFNAGVWKRWEKEPDRGEQNRKFIGEGGFRPDTELSGNELNSLLRRTLMDGYALGVTIWSMARGWEPTCSLFNPDLVDAKWHDGTITGIFNTLYDVGNLTIAGMQKIADRLKDEFPRRFDKSVCIATYGRESEVGFDVEWVEKMDCGDEVEYGKLAEQLNFSGKFNPMLRLYRKGRTVDFPPEAVMRPIIETYSNGGRFINDIYYAPDDAESGCRPVDFENYQPCTLDRLIEKNELKEEDAGELAALGQRIDKYRAEQKRSGRQNPFLRLPYPQDIVKVDGSWMIQPFFLGSFRPVEEISFEEYFKMLCRRDNRLTTQNWADLLGYDRGVGILFELMPENMVRGFARRLNAAAREDPEAAENPAERRKIDSFRRLRGELRKTAKFGQYFSAE